MKLTGQEAISAIVEGYCTDADRFEEDPNWEDCENYWSDWASHYGMQWDDPKLLADCQRWFRYWMFERARVALSQLAIATASNPDAGSEWADERVPAHVQWVVDTIREEEV